MSSRTRWSIVGVAASLLAFAIVGKLLLDEDRREAGVQSVPESLAAAPEARVGPTLRSDARESAGHPDDLPVPERKSVVDVQEPFADEQPELASEPDSLAASPKPVPLDRHLKDLEREFQALQALIHEATFEALSERWEAGDYEISPGLEFDASPYRDKIILCGRPPDEEDWRIVVLPEDEFPEEYEWKRRQIELWDEIAKVEGEIKLVLRGR